MFRRKEDSLFDNATDPNQPLPAEAATVVTSSPAANASQPSTPPAAAAPASNARSAPEPRNTASAFRSASALGSDLVRNRMPEAKTAAVAATATPAAERTKGGRRVLTVGNDILLKGEIATCDRLVIEGKVDATLNEVHTVEIAETGSFKGSAHIEDAEISGLFEGDLVVRNRLVIYATGKVRGKISYGEIEIERGGELTGEIKATSSQGSAAGVRPTRAKEAA